MIGIDIGRVIIASDTDNPNQFFGEDYLNTPKVSGAFESIKELIKRYNSNNIFLVSKCGENTQARTLRWLEHNLFYDETNFERTNVKFCRERINKKKICESFNIQTFIDDRYSVLMHLMDLKQLFLFNPNDEEFELLNNSNQKGKIQLVRNWKEVMKKIMVT